MIILDNELKKREETGKPIRAALVGAGYMGRGIALQILTTTPGMELVAIYNRHPEKAKRAYQDAGIEVPSLVDSVHDLEDNIFNGKYSITENPTILTSAEGIDALVEATGTVEFALQVVLSALENKKHVILVNAELDATLGPYLKYKADLSGVIITNIDGDEPGVQMNLYRFVRHLGFKPVMSGNIKSLYDPYRNPTTQENYARQWGQNAYKVTSYADGTKTSFEQAIVANATGMRVAKRGMYGMEVPLGTPIKEAVKLIPEEILETETGVVDFLIGADPPPGVFVLGRMDNPIQRDYLLAHKMGTGPYYCFYRPYHLCHFEVPNTIARAVIFNDAAIAPLGPPQVDVVAAAKIDLAEGTSLDGIGGYSIYGLCENSPIVKGQNLLPIGLAEGCIVQNRIPKDQVITCSDVIIPEGRLVDQIREEQDLYFA